MLRRRFRKISFSLAHELFSFFRLSALAFGGLPYLACSAFGSHRLQQEKIAFLFSLIHTGEKTSCEAVFFRLSVYVTLRLSSFFVAHSEAQ